MFELIKAIVKLGGAALKGGAIAFMAALGGILGEDAVSVLKPVLDYAWFEAESGYLKDHPGRKNETIVRRLWRIWSCR